MTAILSTRSDRNVLDRRGNEYSHVHALGGKVGDSEAAEFDTCVPHWFGPADDRAVEFLSLFGKQGERAHVRVRPKGS